MRRIKLVIATVTVMVAMMAATAVPAMATVNNGFVGNGFVNDGFVGNGLVSPFLVDNGFFPFICFDNGTAFGCINT